MNKNKMKMVQYEIGGGIRDDRGEIDSEDTDLTDRGQWEAICEVCNQEENKDYYYIFHFIEQKLGKTVNDVQVYNYILNLVLGLRTDYPRDLLAGEINEIRNS